FVAPAFNARWMWRRTPGAYMWVQDASSAMPTSSIVFASSAPATAGAIAIAIALSVHAGSSFAKGSHAGFQLPLADRPGTRDAALSASSRASALERGAFINNVDDIRAFGGLVRFGI